jgi:hypothetical protein
MTPERQPSNCAVPVETGSPIRKPQMHAAVSTTTCLISALGTYSERAPLLIAYSLALRLTRLVNEVRALDFQYQLRQ